MKTMVFGLVVVMSLAFASSARADLIGTPVSGFLSTTPPTTADPSGALGSTTVGSGGEFGGCIGPPLLCGSGAGVSWGVDVTDTTVEFDFFGSTAGSTGSFDLTLSFDPIIQNVVLLSGALSGGSFGLTSFNSSTIQFTGTGEFNAIGGNHIVFGVTSDIPEPAMLALLGSALAGGVVWRRRRR
jgi:hypothetical protein